MSFSEMGPSADISLFTRDDESSEGFILPGRVARSSDPEPLFPADQQAPNYSDAYMTLSARQMDRLARMEPPHQRALERTVSLAMADTATMELNCFLAPEDFDQLAVICVSFLRAEIKLFTPYGDEGKPSISGSRNRPHPTLEAEPLVLRHVSSVNSENENRIIEVGIAQIESALAL
jgi:hypothetical protein